MMEAMKLTVHNAKEFYVSALNNTDTRLADYPLMGTDPRPMIYLVSFYIAFVILGKRFMKNRPAVNVPVWILFVYNFGLVLLSVYMFEEIIVGVFQANYNLLCAQIDLPTVKGEMKVAAALWWYFFSKAIEFLDTFWMIIRKRFNQVTFLHVFHHSTMFVIWWVVCTWIPGGQAYFGASLNCVVHIFMYTYYALSVIPSLKDKLWWKKYITTFQLIQFFITITHTIVGIVRSCEFPMWGQYLLTSYMIIMIVLFSNFYIHEYINKSNLIKKKKLDLNNNLENRHQEKSD